MLQPSQYAELLHSDTDARVLPSGATLFTAGEPATQAFAVLDGAIEVSEDGAVVEVAVRGTLVGELALLGGHRRRTTARALCDTSVVPLDRKRVLELLRDTPYFPVTSQRLAVPTRLEPAQG